MRMDIFKHPRKNQLYLKMGKGAGIDGGVLEFSKPVQSLVYILISEIIVTQFAEHNQVLSVPCKMKPRLIFRLTAGVI